jgi:hypothetical protein
VVPLVYCRIRTILHIYPLQSSQDRLSTKSEVYFGFSRTFDVRVEFFGIFRGIQVKKFVCVFSVCFLDFSFYILFGGFVILPIFCFLSLFCFFPFSCLAHLAFRPCELLPLLFVRRPSVNISHFNLLLRNHSANCNQTLVEWSLDGPLPKCVRWTRLPAKMGAKLKIEKRGDAILIVHCCFIINLNELKFWLQLHGNE